MTEKRFIIENIGNMFRVLDNTEPITTEFENWDKNDIKNLVELLNNLNNENEKLKQSNNEAIGFIFDGIVEMHDGKRDYAESIFNKAIKLLRGDVE